MPSPIPLSLSDKFGSVPDMLFAMLSKRLGACVLSLADLRFGNVLSDFPLAISEVLAAY